MLVGKKSLATISIAATALALVAGCSSTKSKSTTTSSKPAGSGSSPGALPNLKGKSFTVLGQWTGAEQTVFQAALTGFEKATGAKANYTPAAGGDEPGVLGTKVAGGTPPDIAVLSLPAQIAQYGSAGKLQPVSSAGQAAVRANFSPEWAKLATVGGTLYGVPVDASNKSTVWYHTKAFSDAGISGVPATWDELIKDAKTLSDAGVSVPISVGGGDGWTLTDWFENVYLRTAGLNMYDKLTQHKIPWTDPSVTKALTTLKMIWSDKALIGNPADALKVPFPASVDNVFKASPTSGIVYEGSFVTGTITGDKNPAKVGTDAKFFPFPSINGSPAAVEAGGDFASGFTANPCVQPFLQYLASAQAAKALVSSPGSGFISANKNVAASDYADPTSGQLGKQIVAVGDNFRFDMSDQEPAAFGGTPNRGEFADLQAFLANGNVAAAQAKLEADATKLK